MVAIAGSQGMRSLDSGQSGRKPVPKLQRVGGVYVVQVDFNQSFDDMVEAVDLDSVDDRMTAPRSPASGTGVVSAAIKLFVPRPEVRLLRKPEILEELAGHRCQVTEIEYFLALGALAARHSSAYLERHYPLVSLCSQWTDELGRALVPCFKMFEEMPWLDLVPDDGSDWSSHFESWCFAARCL